ncbi:hypothetical protein JJV70_11195 [Streptomyces sp. JJ66]|uniref:hypothetical protein n=1 Tax=Streptomyces sp. JJ66 TaxID=2803843 RepID=UPI001C58E45F|nr:hypothetical protein [Streptomyces sp. JJ66]MBW1602663.1 hypothetical protein [Streptomyces sp. JJ66]
MTGHRRAAAALLTVTALTATGCATIPLETAAPEPTRQPVIPPEAPEHGESAGEGAPTVTLTAHSFDPVPAPTGLDLNDPCPTPEGHSVRLPSGSVYACLEGEWVRVTEIPVTP